MATITEIAAKAGVSVSTASLVLNGRGREKRISSSGKDAGEELVQGLLQLAAPGFGKVGVDLGESDAGISQEYLHGANIKAGFEEQRLGQRQDAVLVALADEAHCHVLGVNGVAFDRWRGCADASCPRSELADRMLSSKIVREVDGINISLKEELNHENNLNNCIGCGIISYLGSCLSFWTGNNQARTFE